MQYIPSSYFSGYIYNNSLVVQIDTIRLSTLCLVEFLQDQSQPGKCVSYNEFYNVFARDLIIDYFRRHVHFLRPNRPYL